MSKKRRAFEPRISENEIQDLYNYFEEKDKMPKHGLQELDWRLQKAAEEKMLQLYQQ